MNQEIYLQDKLATIAENAAILWSTLEAISDAMEDENRAMEIYKKRFAVQRTKHTISNRK